MIKNNKDVYCPLCISKLTYKAIKNKNSDKLDKTHIYICKDCPFIGFEYWNDINATTLKNYLTKKK